MDVNIWKVEVVSDAVGLQPLKFSVKIKSLDHGSSYLPEGAFTSLRTYDGNKTLSLEMHTRRLEHSAGLLGHPLSLDRALLREALRQVVGQLPEGQDARLRVTLDLEDQPGTIYIAVEALQAPAPQAYQRGVKVITCEMKRRFPTAKLTGFIARADLVRSRLPDDVNEAIMLSPQGDLLEGLSSNFFAVKGDKIWTAAEGVLAGVTRSIALETIRNLKLSVNLHAVARSDIPGLREAFITSSSRGVLPVIQVDQTIIGTEAPGKITRRVMDGYQQQVDRLLEVI